MNFNEKCAAHRAIYPRAMFWLLFMGISGREQRTDRNDVLKINHSITTPPLSGIIGQDKTIKKKYKHIHALPLLVLHTLKQNVNYSHRNRVKRFTYDNRIDSIKNRVMETYRAIVGTHVLYNVACTNASVAKGWMKIHRHIWNERKSDSASEGKRRGK